MSFSVRPYGYSILQSDVLSVNGSSVTGDCHSSFKFFTRSRGETAITCVLSTSSLLFDGHIPILTGLEGHTWASQLITVTGTVDITFDFSRTSHYSGVDRVEVALFYCPEWGVGAETVEIIMSQNRVFSSNVSVSSCSSLVKVCLPVVTNSSIVSLRLTPIVNQTIIHLAEVTFFAENSTCPPDAVVSEGKHQKIAIVWNLEL